MPVPHLDDGTFRLAAWSSLPDLGLVDALWRSSFDSVVLDMQHGLHDAQSIHRAIALGAALGKPAVVRVPVGDLAFVSRALDFGASAVILPMIEGAEDARALVEVAKYPPLGQRSFGPPRAAQVFGLPDGPTYMRSANDATLAIAMIETQGAYDDLEAILAVEGIDGVLVGPSDLSLALLGRLDPDGAQIAEATAKIAQRVNAAGKIATIFASDAAAARRAREQGYRFVGISSDASLLRQAADGLVRAVSG